MFITLLFTIIQRYNKSTKKRKITKEKKVEDARLQKEEDDEHGDEVEKAGEEGQGH